MQGRKQWQYAQPKDCNYDSQGHGPVRQPPIESPYPVKMGWSNNLAGMGCGECTGSLPGYDGPAQGTPGGQPGQSGAVGAVGGLDLSNIPDWLKWAAIGLGVYLVFKK
jgi:hypothetical protein